MSSIATASLPPTRPTVPILSTDVNEEMLESGLRPITPDADRLEATLASNEVEAAKVQSSQGELSLRLNEEMQSQNGAMLSRVRVLRDGPMGQVVKSKGRSMFRARIEAKAKVGDMVTKSKVGYKGPVPTAEEYTDATVLRLHERLAGRSEATPEEQALEPLPPVKMEMAHVPQALSELAASAGIDPARINPYLAANGIGACLPLPPPMATTHGHQRHPYVHTEHPLHTSHPHTDHDGPVQVFSGAESAPKKPQS